MAAFLRLRRSCDVVRALFNSSYTKPLAAVSLHPRHHSTTTSFYNRHVEMRQLQALAQHGNLVLLTGPENAGKSALLKQFVQLQQTRQIPGYPILIDMRGGTFHNSAAFCKALKSQSIVVAIAILDALQQLPYGGNFLQNLYLPADITSFLTRMQQADDLNSLLDTLYSLMFAYEQRAKTFLHGHAAGLPSLIIDEANCLHRWSLDPVEQEALNTLQRFFIKVTKQDNIANVILGTSDDFFSFYLDSHLGSDRYTTGLVGDLVKEDAFEFFRLALEKLGETSVPSALWDDIFDVLGGRVMLLRKLAQECSSFDDPWASHWSELKVEILHRAVLEAQKGYYPATIHPKWTLPPPAAPAYVDNLSEGLLKDSNPAWKEEDWAYVVRQMSVPPLGVVALEDLAGKVSRKAVFSMVQHKLIHYRREPCLQWAHDLEEYKGPYPIVMPKSRPHYKAFCKLAAVSH